MKHYIIVILVGIVLLGCANASQQEQGNGITISGTIMNPPAGLITLEKMTQTAVVPIDTIVINDDNTYTVNFSEPAGFYRINFFGQRASTIIIDQDDLVIDYDGNSSTGNVRPVGSREIDMIESFYKTVGEEFGSREQSINVAFQKASQEGNMEEVENLRDEYMDLQKEKQEYSASLIKNYEVNLATFQLLSSIETDGYLDLKDSLAAILNSKYPGRFYIEEMISSLDMAKATAIGQLAPEISLPNPEGEVVNLSSFQGQVVLVDFWAQWCKPCRLENPNVVKAYNKFKDKGFTVYGVSLDRTKDKWLQAIEEDGLTWTHVSDLKYFQSVAAQAYNVSAIPFSILLDRDGKIIAKNLRGKVLDETLAEYFEAEGKM